MIFGWQLGAVKSSMLTTVDLGVILAAIAIVVTVVFNILDHWRQRRHARMSVRPHITFERYELVDRLGITMVNRGLGPARIMRIVHFVDDAQVKPDIRDPRFLVDILANQCGIRDVAPTVKLLGLEQIVEKSEALDLINLTLAKGAKSADARASLAVGLRKIGILVVYRSLYDELFVAHTFSSPEARGRAIGSKSGKELLRMFPEQHYELQEVP